MTVSAAPDAALLVFKRERILQAYLGTNPAGEYPLTAFSGGPGPKLCEGDRQIPEGIYRIVLLNPASRFHLSLKLDYPNDFDRLHAAAEGRTSPGSDICIHGGASSVGCIAVGDRAIEEIYGLVARCGKEHVRVILAPYDMRGGRDSGLERNACGKVWYADLCARIEEALRAYPRPEKMRSAISPL